MNGGWFEGGSLILICTWFYLELMNLCLSSCNTVDNGCNKHCIIQRGKPSMFIFLYVFQNPSILNLALKIWLGLQCIVLFVIPVYFFLNISLLCCIYKTCRIIFQLFLQIKSIICQKFYLLVGSVPLKITMHCCWRSKQCKFLLVHCDLKNCEIAIYFVIGIRGCSFPFFLHWKTLRHSLKFFELLLYQSEH